MITAGVQADTGGVGQHQARPENKRLEQSSGCRELHTAKLITRNIPEVILEIPRQFQVYSVFMSHIP